MRPRRQPPVADLPLPPRSSATGAHAVQISDSTAVLFGSSAPVSKDAVIEGGARRVGASEHKINVSGPIYSVAWEWCARMRDSIDREAWTESSYPRQMQILAEVLVAAVESGLDVSQSMSLADVRRRARAHFAAGQSQPIDAPDRSVRDA